MQLGHKQGIRLFVSCVSAGVMEKNPVGSFISGVGPNASRFSYVPGIETAGSSMLSVPGDDTNFPKLSSTNRRLLPSELAASLNAK